MSCSLQYMYMSVCVPASMYYLREFGPAFFGVRLFTPMIDTFQQKYSPAVVISNMSMETLCSSGVCMCGW